MENQAAAFHMPQEVVSQTDTVTGTLDQSRNVCHDKGLFLCHANHTQHRCQGGEVIVGDLGLCRTDYGDQGRLAHIGEAHQSHICQQLQFQCDIKCLTRKARLCKTGDLSGRCGKMDIALSASAALCKDLRLIGGEVCHDPTGLGFPHHGAAGHADHQIRCTLSGTIAGTAVFAALCHILPLIAEIDQGRKVVIYLKDHVAAFSAVAAVRSACRHVLFPMERNCTIAAVACFNRNPCLIDKHLSHLLSYHGAFLHIHIIRKSQAYKRCSGFPVVLH